MNADVNFRAAHGFSPLHVAALRAESEPSNSDDGSSPDDLLNRLYSVARRTAEQVDDESFSVSDRRGEDDSVVRVLTGTGADVAQVNNNGVWPGMLATGVRASFVQWSCGHL